jgi:hypothetical protein
LKGNDNARNLDETGDQRHQGNNGNDGNNNDNNGNNNGNNGNNNDNNGNEDNDTSDVDGPTVSSFVDLARTIRMSGILDFIIIANGVLVRIRSVEALAAEIQQPRFPSLIRRFLYDQQYPNNVLSSSDVPLAACPTYTGKIRVYNSAVATFHAPSDPSGIGGMHREHIRAAQSWRNGPGRYDCVFLNQDPDFSGIAGMSVVRVLLFFAFDLDGTTYPCAFVHWFKILGDKPDEDTGMWVTMPEVHENGLPVVSIIHLDCIICPAHLTPIFGTAFVPKTLKFYQTLDSFKTFYVNKFINHNAFEIAV